MRRNLQLVAARRCPKECLLHERANCAAATLRWKWHSSSSGVNLGEEKVAWVNWPLRGYCAQHISRRYHVKENVGGSLLALAHIRGPRDTQRVALRKCPPELIRHPIKQTVDRMLCAKAVESSAFIVRSR